jgi:MFS family permease
MPENNSLVRNWHILALITITGTLAVAIPFSCMPVLFSEISQDLGLSLVQIGVVWGIASMAGIFVSILAGVLTDKFGVKTILWIFCILTGLTGALRGLSHDFFSLAATVFLNGMARLFIPVAVTKAVGLWFKGPRLGLAQGIGALGMGAGLMLGPLISATVLSPALGGWKHVMFFYGGISASIGILWLVIGKTPPEASTTDQLFAQIPIRQALSRLLRIKELWLLGVSLMLRIGGIMGMTGYLSLYLSEDRLWDKVAADGALSIFYALSTIFVVPLSFLSDKIGLRKAIMLPAMVMTMIGIGLVPLVSDNIVWVLMALAGMTMDGFMALLTTTLMETKEVGMAYTGMAVGIIFTIAQIGNLFSPPLGNYFARINPGLPFAFWAFISLGGLITFFFVRETGWRKTRALR